MERCRDCCCEVMNKKLVRGFYDGRNRDRGIDTNKLYSSCLYDINAVMLVVWLAGPMISIYCSSGVCSENRRVAKVDLGEGLVEGVMVEITREHAEAVTALAFTMQSCTIPAASVCLVRRSIAASSFGLHYDTLQGALHDDAM